MKFESSNRVAARAVATLEKNARAEAISFSAQAKEIGRGRQTIGRKYARGDMLMSEFVAISSKVGVNPAAILADALENTATDNTLAAGKENE